MGIYQEPSEESHCRQDKTMSKKSMNALESEACADLVFLGREPTEEEVRATAEKYQIDTDRLRAIVKEAAETLGGAANDTGLEDIDPDILELARLEKPAYDEVRKKQAADRGIGVVALDTLVKAARKAIKTMNKEMATIEEIAEAEAVVMERTAEQERRRQEQQEEARRIGEDGWDVKGHQTAEIITLDDAIEHFGFVAKGSQVIDLRNPKLLLPVEDWGNLYAASIEAKRAAKKIIKTPVSKLWMESIDRKQAYNTTFHAGKGEVCLDPNGLKCFNTWRPIVRLDADPALAQPFIDHIAELWGADAGRFLDWLAHIEQQPGILPQMNWLCIADKHGTGRNWISSVLARVWRGYVAANFDLSGTLKDGFNDRLSARLLAAIDELREGGGNGQWAHEHRFRQLSNEEFRTINPKHGKKHVEHNCCRLLAFSNSPMALPLGPNDRRVEVARYKGSPKSAAYYTWLYGLLNNREFIDGLGNWFGERDISAFNAGARAVMTGAKRDMIAATETEVGRDIATLIAHWPLPWITTKQLLTVLMEPGSQADRLNTHMKAALQERGAIRLFTDQRPRFPDGRQDIWRIKDHDKAEKTPTKEVIDRIRQLYEEHSVPEAGGLGRKTFIDWAEVLADIVEKADDDNDNDKTPTDDQIRDWLG
jgi:hypothetical protein